MAALLGRWPRSGIAAATCVGLLDALDAPEDDRRAGSRA